MKLSINGKLEELPEGVNLSRLLELKKIRPEVVTVELNEEIINRARYSETSLKEGDKLEFVYYMGGGSTSPAALSVVEGLTTGGYKSEYYVYMARCRNGALYTGVTNNLIRRLREHTIGKEGSYTRYNSPIEIVYKERFSNLAEARNRETQLKGWTRRKKEALISGDLQLLKIL